MTSFSRLKLPELIAYDPVLHKPWIDICAFAWVQTNNGSKVLDHLRKDPKSTVQGIAKGGYNAPLDIATQAAIIVQKSEDTDGAFTGYLPIPAPIGGLETLTKDNLRILLKAGITGALRFDERADLWASIFYEAWNDLQLLYKIRQDPLGNLPQVKGINVDDLQNSTYGILPIPDEPEGLKSLDIDQLESVGKLDNFGGFFALHCT